jgi:hypothetical protein
MKGDDGEQALCKRICAEQKADESSGLWKIAKMVKDRRQRKGRVGEGGPGISPGSDPYRGFLAAYAGRLRE